MIKILVADDDDLLLEFVRRTLERHLYKVLAAEDGEKALELARSDAPDVIVLDVMMPGRDGFNVLKELKADPATADTPVIMLTARKTEGDVNRGMERGAADYLLKPFMPEELLMRIDRILDKYWKNDDIFWVSAE